MTGALARRVVAIRLLAAGFGAFAISTAIAAAAPPPTSPEDTTAGAFLAQIVVPDRDPVVLGALQWPASTTADVQSFEYPDDGSIVSLGRSHASIFVARGAAATTSSESQVGVISLFGGEIVAGQVALTVSASASMRTTSADVSSSSVAGLRALGQDVPTTPGSTVTLSDWGSLTVLAGTTSVRKKNPPGATASVVGFRVHLTAEHGGLPAGSEIVIGSAQATAVAQPVSGPPPPPKATPTTVPTARPNETPTPAPAPEQKVGGEVAGGPVRVAPAVTAKLSAGGYVFPVFGTVSFGDSFGAPRADVQGGWHHGEDIFAKKGTPLLAVANGTVHTIGFNRIGGYRIWLRDAQGNEFYYAHLSAYSPLAVEGAKVEAGDVIGFVGDTGDAEGTPHLHFEIHPASMLSMGYDGVVAPYPILLAWERSEDISFSAGRVFVAAANGGASTLPPPGAVLLQSQDIGSASGLQPGALERVLEAPRVSR